MPGHTRSSITDHNTHRIATRKSTRWAASLVVTVALTLPALYHSSQALEPRPATPKPGTVAPTLGGAQPGGPAAPAGRVVPPPTRPPSAGSTPRTTPLVGPTPDLTAVANAIGMRAKSLTLLITVRPGLSLTQAVTISIAYISPAGGVERLTQSYVAATGNRFLRHDPEGDGKPRLVHLDITLTEPKQGGGIYSFNMPDDVYLDPLYDVSIGPLQIFNGTPCRFYDTRIVFKWLRPDLNGTEADFDQPELDFHMGWGKVFAINEFAWARAEVSASANLHTPVLGFNAWCWEPGFSFRYNFGLNSTRSVNLVPGKSQTVKGNLTAVNDASNKAGFEYPITYTLRWYPYL